MPPKVDRAPTPMIVSATIMNKDDYYLFTRKRQLNAFQHFAFGCFTAGITVKRTIIKFTQKFITKKKQEQ